MLIFMKEILDINIRYGDCIILVKKKRRKKQLLISGICVLLSNPGQSGSICI